MNPPKHHWLDVWHVNPSLNRNYDLIDGLRGVAILLVLAAHHFYINPQSSPTIRFIGGAIHAGGFGVRVFFALSGFLISLPFWKRKLQHSENVIPGGYGWRRFWKIYPPLALSILVFTPIYILVSNDPSYLKTAGQWLVGTPLVIPVSSQLNPVMWSLVVEAHFYIVLPFLFLCLKKTSARASLWILTGLFLLLPNIWRWFIASKGIYFSLHSEINVLFPALLDNFACGILLAGLVSLKVMRPGWARLGDFGFILLAVSICVSSWLQLFPHPNDHLWLEIPEGLVKIASACLLCYVADPHHPRSRFLAQPWLRWCGIISYEWYLVHQPILFWARMYFGPSQGSLWKYMRVLAVPFCISLLLAAVFYRFFSLPILKRGRLKNSPDGSASHLPQARSPIRDKCLHQ